jgi:GNAT superfamily N-acetyltransferase
MITQTIEPTTVSTVSTSVSTLAPTSVANEELALSVITLAFSTDPFIRWTLPDSHQYLAYFPKIMKAFAGKAFEHGSAHHAEDFAGVALWLPPHVSPDEDELVPLLESAIPRHLQDDFFAIFEEMGHYHPHEPHWYLPVIGVDPSRQNQGHGSRLLQQMLAQCDQNQTCAYLESSNPRNMSLYERHGFEVMGTIQKGSSPPIYPMLRMPR